MNVYETHDLTALLAAVHAAPPGSRVFTADGTGGVGLGAPVQALGKGRVKIGLRGAQPQWLSLQKCGLQSIHAGIVEMFAPCREVFCRGVCSRPDLTHRQAFMRQIASIWTVYMQSHTAHDEGEPAILDKKSRIMLVFPL